MPIYQTATYRVEPSAIDEVKAAIVEFVEYVRTNESGTTLYAAWQEMDDPTEFVHLFIFRDKEAQEAHSESDAVARFEAVYSPHLVGGPVVFTDHVLVADNLRTST
jgi:quinol monooxygenase YgiN